MRSLVTGATGFIGGRIVRALVERGDRVRALVRDPPRAGELAALGVEVAAGDLTDKASLAPAVEGVDRVFHAAGLVGEWLDRGQAVEVNVGGTGHLLEAATDAGVARAVHVSSLSVLGTVHHRGTDESAPYLPGDPYTDTKIASEQIARTFDIAAVIRPGFVYGPGDRTVLAPMVARILEGKFVFVGEGSKEMNTVYVDDVVQAALLAADAPDAAGQVYNVTDGRNTTIREFANFIADALGVPRPTRQLPVPLAKGATGVLETLARAARAKTSPPLNRSRLRFLYFNQRYSIEKARRELGYEPRLSYREGLPPALDWLRETGLIASGSLEDGTVKRGHT